MSNSTSNSLFDIYYASYGIVYTIKDGANGTANLVGDQGLTLPSDPTSIDYLAENANVGTASINFDGKTGEDVITLANDPLRRTITASLTAGGASPAATFTIRSEFENGRSSTITANNVEFLEYRNSNLLSLNLAALYLDLYNYRTATQFTIDETNRAGALNLSAVEFTADANWQFGAAHDIFYEFDSRYSAINMGAGNDMVSGTQTEILYDGGSGIDTYVFYDRSQYSFDNRPRASQGLYQLADNGYVDIFIQDDNGAPSFPMATLRNFEMVNFGDRTIRLNVATHDTSLMNNAFNMRGVTGQYNVMIGANGNDTIRGVSAGETLIGHGGNDVLIAGTAATQKRNLLVNGSFETNPVGKGRWGYTNNLQGWTGLARTETGIVANATIEIWNSYSRIKATDGDSFIELDANRNINGISQSVQTKNGQLYKLTLDFAARLNIVGTAPERSRNGDSFSIFWNDQKLGDYSSRTNSWTTLTLQVTGTGNLDQLRFFENSAQNDSYGVLLDNVTLEEYQPLAEHAVNVLDGGAGRDTLIGSNVIDRFVFREGTTGNTLETADVIQNFAAGRDIVDLSSLLNGENLYFVDRFTGGSFGHELTLQSIIINNRRDGVLASVDMNRDQTADYAIYFKGITSLDYRALGARIEGA